MAIVPFHIVDAFADQPFTGNPAAIIPNATGLSDQEMQGISGELSMEAGFILPPSVSGADIRLRFFTQRGGAALSGHVALAAFASMADRGFYRVTSTGLAVKLETGVGILPVRLDLREDGRVQVSLDMPAPRFGEPVAPGEVAAALGVPATCLVHRGVGPQRVSCGFDQIVVPVCEREVMRGEFRDTESVGGLTDRLGVGGLALGCPHTHSGFADFHLRFFHPRFGANEEIASGTSMGAAAAFLVQNGLTPPGDVVELIMEQGHALGRPTLARVRVDVSDRRIETITVSGPGIVVMRGSFHFPRQMAVASG